MLSIWACCGLLRGFECGALCMCGVHSVGTVVWRGFTAAAGGPLPSRWLYANRDRMQPAMAVTTQHPDQRTADAKQVKKLSRVSRESSSSSAAAAAAAAAQQQQH
eukprot:COSAG01_NODE_2804_length_7046_cov_1030.843242_2_plen_105_part_00